MSETSTASSGRRDWRLWIGLPAFYLALAIALTWPAATTFTTRIAGDFGDGFQNLWNFWWLKQALLHFQNPFFTHQLWHPFGTTLVFQTMTWPDALVVLPLWAVLPPLGVYNAAVLWSFVLTGLGMYALVHDASGNRPAALFAGAAFMVVPFHMAHALGHQHLVSIGYLPLYLMFLHRICKGGTLRDAVLGGLCLACAALCSWYQLLFALVWTLGVFGSALVSWRSNFLSRAFAARALVLGGCFLVVCGPLLFAMMRAAHGEPVVGAHDAGVYSADLESFFFPGARMAWSTVSHRFGRWSGNASENGDYLGYVLLALAAVGAWKKPLARAYAATGLVGALLSMGPSLHVAGRLSLEGAMPYAWLTRAIPALNFGGVPVRFGLVAQGSLVVMAGLGLGWLMERAPRKLALGAPVLATALILVELWPMQLPTSVWPVPAPFADWSKDRSNFTVLDLSGDTRMLWNAIHHGHPCVGGYVTRVPERLTRWWNAHPVLGLFEREPEHLTVKLNREDARLDFNWGGGGPARGVQPDFFTVHWDGEIAAPKDGTYAFHVSADDGADLFIDGAKIVAAPLSYQSTWQDGSVHLTAGRHALAVDFHELRGGANVHVQWEGPGVPRGPLVPAGGSFHGTYADGQLALPVSQAQAQQLLRELDLRYVVLDAGDRMNLSLYARGAGLKPIWQGDGLAILEVPPAATAEAKSDLAAAPK